MANRKLIRPDSDRQRGGGPRSVRRKKTPPEQTNAEEFYYLKQMSSRTPMLVVLTSGEEVRGWIEWYDKDAVKIHRNDAPNLLIRKDAIRYMLKQEELDEFGHRGVES